MMRFIKTLFLKYLYFKKNTIIKSWNVSLSSTIGKFCIIEKGVHISHDSSINDYSYVNANSSIENSTIGKFCSISSGVLIGPYEHDYKVITTHPFYRENFYGFLDLPTINVGVQKRTVIGNDVWIGVNVMIKAGVEIGNGAVIGAGSVVTKNVPPYEIWGGVPACFIKMRFDQDVIELLSYIDWVNKDPAWIQKHMIPNISKDISELCEILKLRIDE